MSDDTIEELNDSMTSFNDHIEENSTVERENRLFSNQGEQNNMAPSYAKVASESVGSRYGPNPLIDNDIQSVKPIFVKESDVFGDINPPKQFWLSHVELYKALGGTIKTNCVKGIQRIGKMWRIYIDNEDDRQKLLIEGIILRDKMISLCSQNPRNPNYDKLIRVKIQNIPLSADDGQIERAISLKGIEVVSLSRERLRVDNKLTNCQTGDRILMCKKFEKPLSKSMKIGKYLARIYHFGQRKDTEIFICSKCLQHGHFIDNCPNDWTCRRCNASGHRMLDCPEFLANKLAKEVSDEIERENQFTESKNDETQESTQLDSDIDSEEEDEETQQSQSILVSKESTGKEKKQVQIQEKVSTEKQDQKCKNKPENKDQKDPKGKKDQNKDESEKKKRNTQAKPNSKQNTDGKQSEITSFVTPRGEKNNTRKKRTPPSQPDRGSKLSKS